MLTYLWAYLAGTLTLINPCVLPLLPIVIAAAFQSGRVGPLALAGGLTVSLAAVGVGVTAFGHLIGIDDELINRIAAAMMVAFGVVLLVPRAQGFVSALASPLASGASERIDGIGGAGPRGQFAIGVLLGAVWSPCIGPTLGGAIGLAATGESLGHAALTMVVFGIGVSTVLLALAYGSQGLLNARRAKLAAWVPLAKPVMGIALLVVGVALFFHLERGVEGWLLDVLPVWLIDLSVAF